MTSTPTLGDLPVHQLRIGLPLVLRAARNWWLWCLLAGIPLAAAGGITVWLLFEPVYRAVAWLRIQDRQHVAFPGGDDTERFVQTQRQLLRSPIVLNSVISNPEIAHLKDLQEEEDSLAWLSQHLVVESFGKSEVFQVSIEASTPEASKKIVDSVLDSYLKTITSEVDEQTYRLIQILEEDLNTRKSDLEGMRKKVRELAQAASKSGAMVASGSKKEVTESGVISTIHELMRQLLASESSRTLDQAQLKAMEQTHETEPVPAFAIENAVDDHPRVRHLLGAIEEKRAKLHEVMSRVRPDHRENSPQAIKSIESEIASFEDRLEQVRDEIKPKVTQALQDQVSQGRDLELDTLKQKIKNAELLEQVLAQRLEEQKKLISDTGGDTYDLEFAQQELDRANKTHDIIADRVEHLRTEMRAPERVSLVSQATMPKKPVQEIPYKNMIGAGMAGLLFPFFLAVLWEIRIRRIAEPDQVTEETNLPVLGEVTFLPVRTIQRKDNPSNRFELDRDTFEESIDYLRTSMLLSHAIDNVQVIAVASANSNEGKSSLAAHLAASLARSSEEPILLIDADLRDPDAHRIFGVENSPGLAEVLEGSERLDEALLTMPVGTPHILPAGHLTRSPHILLSEGRFARIVEKLRPAYRHIVIDMPPVLPAGDALLIARSADGTLLCTMRDRSRGPQVRLACERLTRSGARLMGAVLSGVPRQTYVQRYGSYHYTYSRNWYAGNGSGNGATADATGSNA